MTSHVFSFLDIKGAISGPGGAFSIGSDAGAAEEGITVEYAEEKGTMQIGAGGRVQHSLHASKAGKIAVRLLKTSPVNALLSNMYAFQASSGANWGQNVLTFNDVARGDFCSGREAAFVKHPTVVYGKDGAMNEWEFNVGNLDILLGAT